jgi:hypothetical protein
MRTGKECIFVQCYGRKVFGFWFLAFGFGFLGAVFFQQQLDSFDLMPKTKSLKPKTIHKDNGKNYCGS